MTIKKSYTKHIIYIYTPTTFFLFSDGFPDQLGGENGRKFMSSKFRDYLAEIHQKPMSEQYSLLENKLKEWQQGHEQNDDIIIIGFKLE